MSNFQPSSSYGSCYLYIGSVLIVKGDVVQQIQVGTLEVAFWMILHHHNGDFSLNIDETLVNFTKQSTQQREKERKNKEREDPSESQKRKNPKGIIKGQLWNCRLFPIVLYVGC